ncbi:hypothetical protein ABPG75_003692 [Micractinium tetrahymenae]
MQRPAWSPVNDRRYQPAFKAAAHALLLAAHRLSRKRSNRADGGKGGGISCPSDLRAARPQALLLHMLGQAAYPLSAWAPMDARKCSCDMAALELRQLLLSNLELSADRLRSEIAELSAEELVGGEPLPLYHVAALVGRPAAVRALAAAGLPISQANTISNVTPVVCSLIGARKPKRWVAEGGTALTLAARLGNAKTVRALLQTGADPSTGEPPTLPAMARHHPAVPPAIVSNIVAQLIAARVDVLAVPGVPWLLAQAGCTVAAHLLLAHIFAKSAAGQLAAPAGAAVGDEHRSALRQLMQAAAALDDVAAFSRFAAAALQQMPALASSEETEDDTGEGANADEQRHSQLDLFLPPLQAALRAGSTRVLWLAVQAAAAAAPAAEAAAPRQVPAEAAELAAQWPLLCTCMALCMPLLLEDAVREGHAPQLRLLLSGGCTPHLSLLGLAVQRRQPEALRVLLSAGRSAVPRGAYTTQGARYMVPMLPTDSSTDWRYTCPLLAALQERVHESRQYGIYWQREDPGRGPTAKDRQLLPLVESLVEAGYRPAVYERVTVYRYGTQSDKCQPCFRERFDPAADDEGLDLAWRNRWLWLAMQRPAWSPAEHARYAPAFRDATRCLLLTAHRLSKERSSRAGSSGARSISCPADLLAALPPDLVLHVLQLAAYPPSAWS